MSRRRRFCRQLRAQRRRLESYDAEERAAAGAALVDLGLTRRVAKALARHVSQEEEGRVRVAIAMAVLRRDNGSRRRRVRRLRSWAAEELVEHGHPVHGPLERKRATRRTRRVSWRAPAAS